MKVQPMKNFVIKNFMGTWNEVARTKNITMEKPED